MQNKVSNKQTNRYKEKYFPCISDKDTPPYNDVMRVITNHKTGEKERIFIKGLTEEQKIAEGTRPEYQHQLEKITAKQLNEETGLEETVVIRTIGRFEKTEEERIQLYGDDKIRGVHTNKPHPGKWVSTPTISPKGDLIVHLKNKRKGENFNVFKTTYSFSAVAVHEIFQVLATIINLNLNKTDDHVLNYVTKYYHLGKTIYGKAS